MTNDHPVVFRKLKKESRFLYHIEDKIVPVENLMTCQAKIPLDISIRSKLLSLSHNNQILLIYLIDSTLASTKW